MAKMMFGLDKEFAKVLLSDRMVPEELEDVLREREVDPDIATAIGVMIEGILEEHPELAGSKASFGVIAGYFLTRAGVTIKQRVDLNDLSEAELRDIRTIRRNYYRVKAQQITAEAEAKKAAIKAA
jgi:hypothetical protein